MFRAAGMFLETGGHHLVRRPIGSPANTVELELPNTVRAIDVVSTPHRGSACHYTKTASLRLSHDNSFGYIGDWPIHRASRLSRLSGIVSQTTIGCAMRSLLLANKYSRLFI